MYGLIFLGLLSAGLFAVVLDGSGSAEPTPDEGPDDTVNGSNGPDTITAFGSETVNGFGGNDVLSTDAASDGATINGQGGSDTLVLRGANGTATGGAGNDVLASFDVENASLDGGSGNDDITFQTSTGGAQADGQASGGDGNDTITAFGVGGIVDGGAGDDLINVQGSLDSVFGGLGDDTILADSADYGGNSPVDGGAGDDRITLSESAGFGITQRADGGAGDDVIRSERFDDSDSADILTGGDGSDTFELFQVNLSGDPSAGADLGTVTEITDFDPEEDSLVIDLSSFPVFDAEIDASNHVALEVSDLADGSGSEVAFTITNADADGPITGTIFLSGITGLDVRDIDLAIATSGAEAAMA